MNDTVEIFESAAEHIKILVDKLDKHQLLDLYGLYKQAREGPCTLSSPRIFDIQAKKKWKAWKDVSKLSQNEARERYIQMVQQIDPNWQYTDVEKKQLLGVAVSRMLAPSDICDDDIFDWVKNGNECKVTDWLNNEHNNPNLSDSSQMTLLHWASDRGNLRIVELLIKHGANVNAEDIEKQTPLHYAASCNHVEIVKLLLSSGADSEAQNNEKETAYQLTDDLLIKTMLGNVFSDHQKNDF